MKRWVWYILFSLMTYTWITESYIIAGICALALIFYSFVNLDSSRMTPNVFLIISALLVCVMFIARFSIAGCISQIGFGFVTILSAGFKSSEK